MMRSTKTTKPKSVAKEIEYVSKEDLIKKADEFMNSYTITNFDFTNCLTTYNSFVIKRAGVGIPLEKRWIYYMMVGSNEATYFVKISMWRGLSWADYLNTANSKTAQNNISDYERIARVLLIGSPGRGNKNAVSPATVSFCLGPLARLLADGDAEFKKGKSNIFPLLMAHTYYPGIMSTELWDDDETRDHVLRVEAALILAKQQDAYITRARRAAGSEDLAMDKKKEVLLKSLKNFHYQFSGYNFASRKKITLSKSTIPLKLNSYYSDKVNFGVMSEKSLNLLVSWIVDPSSEVVSPELFGSVYKDLDRFTSIDLSSWTPTGKVASHVRA